MPEDFEYNPKDFVQRQIKESYEKEKRQAEFIKNLKSQAEPERKSKRLPKYEGFKLQEKIKEKFAQEKKEVKEKRQQKISKGIKGLLSAFSRQKGQEGQREARSQTIQKLFEIQRLKQARRKISPREPYFQKLKQTRGMSNLNMRDVVYDHDLQRAKILTESSIRNQELSPNTRAILNRIKEIQTRGLRADDRQQRIHRERRILQNATDILRTPSIFDSKNTRGKLDFTGVPTDNILNAPNIFKEDKINNPNILKTNRFNILQTKEAGNNLFF